MTKQPLFADDILEVIAARRDGKITVTDLQEALRHPDRFGLQTRVWRRLPGTNDFIDLVESFGFTVERAYTKAGNIRATFITI